VRDLLGPSFVTEDEDPQLYEDLLAEVGAAVRALDIMDWFVVQDIVNIVWETRRARLARASLMRTAREDAVREKIRRSTKDSQLADSMAESWSKGGEPATRIVKELLAQAHLSERDVTGEALLRFAEEFDRLNEREEKFQSRRNSSLKQIERRHAVCARQLRRASENLIEVVGEPHQALARRAMDKVSADRR
jgi:hypothetical protein